MAADVRWRRTPRDWWRERDLVGVAPLVWRRHRIHGMWVRELEFWGRTDTPLGGWVDVLVEDAHAWEVAADFADWLARSSGDWSLLNYLHLAPGSPTLAALKMLAPRWPRVDLTRVLHSLEYELELPADPSGWHGPLGPKARHEVRRQMRRFERRGGRGERVTEPHRAEGIVTALRSLLTASWGDGEAYFRRDPAFGGFAADAIESALEAGCGWVLVAHDKDGIAACLVMLAVDERAVATLLGLKRTPECRRLSLGKCLFHEAIGDATARGCRRFSFLTEGGYKRTFWHAEGQPIESGFVARGVSGWLIAAGAGVRRIAPARIRGCGSSGMRDGYRP